jgi:hypothetical protein
LRHRIRHRSARHSGHGIRAGRDSSGGLKGNRWPPGARPGIAGPLSAGTRGVQWRRPDVVIGVGATARDRWFGCRAGHPHAAAEQNAVPGITNRLPRAAGDIGGRDVRIVRCVLRWKGFCQR